MPKLEEFVHGENDLPKKSNCKPQRLGRPPKSRYQKLDAHPFKIRLPKKKPDEPFTRYVVTLKNGCYHKFLVCNQCRMVSLTNQNMMKHIETHTKVKTFKCTMCTLAFSNRLNRDHHMRYKLCMNPHYDKWDLEIDKKGQCLLFQND